MGRRATMNDIAAEAGVSQGTVSLVLNGRTAGRVSEETAARVREVARRLGFSANAHARVLREGRSRMIGFIGDEVASAPFAGGIIKGAQEQAWDEEHVLLSVDSNGDPGLERAAISMMLSYSVVGIVYAAMYHRIVDLPASLAGVPVVCVNAQDSAGVVQSVFPDEVRGGREAAELLIGQGHRRIAIINIDPAGSRLPAAAGRLAGFHAVMAEHGLCLPDEFVRHGTGNYESGLYLTRELMALPEPPTAIFCANDRTALGCYQAIRESGREVPTDVSVVGFDDQDILMDCFVPGLTTFRLPFEEMGRLAVRKLLHSPSRSGERAPLHCPPVLRGSVRAQKEIKVP